MTAFATEAEPLSSRLAAVLVIAIFSALIWGAISVATAFAVAGMDSVIGGIICTTLAVPLVLAIELVARLSAPSDGRCGNDPFRRQRR